MSVSIPTWQPWGEPAEPEGADLTRDEVRELRDLCDEFLGADA